MGMLRDLRRAGHDVQVIGNRRKPGQGIMFSRSETAYIVQADGSVRKTSFEKAKEQREKEQQKEQGLVAVTSKTGGKVKKKKPKPFFKI